MRLELVRLYQFPFKDSKQTEGVLYVVEDNKILFECHTLELPWRDNANGISCIPAGTYKVKKRLTKYSKFKYEHFHLTDVGGRSYILIHKGNYHHQIEGCILVGDNYIDINGDGIKDVTSSGPTLEKLLELMPDEFEMDIKWR